MRHHARGRRRTAKDGSDASSPWRASRHRLALLLLGVLVVAAAAGAHVSPQESFPAAGARLGAAPDEVWVEFSEAPDAESVKLEVLDARHENVATGEPVVDGARARVPLSPGLPDGGYLVKWGMISAIDGHRMSGSWSFSIGDAALPAPAGAQEADFPWSIAAGKALAFVGLALVGGGIATRAYVLPADARAPLGHRLDAMERSGALLQIVGLAIFLAGQSALAGANPVSYAVATGFGRSLGVRLALAAVVLAWLFARRARSGAWGRRVDLALGVATVVAYGAHGHAAAAFEPYALGVAVDALHLAAVVAWTGGLACLAVLLRSDLEPKLAVEASGRFGRMATACVVVMSLTGMALLVSVVGWDVRTWGAHLQTRYGVLLAAMVLLGLVMIGLGAVNKYRFLSWFASSPGKERRHAFRWSVMREASVGLAVLLVAAAVTNLPPGIANAATAEVVEPCRDASDPVACYVDMLKIVQTERGSEAAFALLEQLAKEQKELAPHLHYLGHELGIHALGLYGSIDAALANCSLKASQGCIDGAIETYLKQVPVLDEPTIAGVCRPGSPYWNWTCNHGVGHGVVQATGYELNESLGLCDLLQPDHRSFCYEGAFMENALAYMGLVMEHEGGTYTGYAEPVRAPGDPHYPCSVMPTQYLNACWLFQADIILYLNEGNFTRAFAACAAVPTYNGTCTIGLGNAAAHSTQMDPRAVSLCGGASEDRLRALCIRGFVAYTIENSASAADGLAVCKGVMEAYKATCYRHLGTLLRDLLDAPARGRACANAELGYERQCRIGAGLP